MGKKSPFIYDILFFKIIATCLSRANTSKSVNNDFEIFKIFFDTYTKLKEYYTTNSLAHIYSNFSYDTSTIEYNSSHPCPNISKDVYILNDMVYKHWIFNEFDNRQQFTYIFEIIQEYSMHLYILKHNTLCCMPKLHDIVLYIDKDDKINIIIQMELLKNLHDIRDITDEKIESILNKHQYAFNKNENSLHKTFLHYINNIFEELNKKYKFTYYDRNYKNILYNDNNDIVVLDFDGCQYKGSRDLPVNSGLCRHTDFIDFGLRYLQCETCKYEKLIKFANPTNIKRRNSI
jgi:hypothetical protein